MKETLDYCAQVLRERGVDKFQCSLANTKQYEMNLEGTAFSLIRTITDNTLSIIVIKDQRKGSISLNSVDEQSIRSAVDTALELSSTSQPDPDYDISPQQEAQTFQSGPKEPEAERMYELLKEYSTEVPRLFPTIKLMETTFMHTHAVTRFINSNGVDFVTDQGVYELSSIFASKDGEKATSFNYSGFTMQDLERSLLERGSLEVLLRQSEEHLEAKPFVGQFVGDVIFTPDCLHNLLYYYAMTFLGDGAMIGGTSPFKNKLGQKVASEKLTISSQPVADAMASGYFVTSDGFAAENVTFVDEGVLKSFLLSQYGSKKTGLERAKNEGRCWVVEPGEKTFAEMISQVERGLLVARYSGGSPSSNGDFSAVAKNSYYIENGKIMYPVTETMVAGNMADMFAKVKEISSERIDFGEGIIPYLLTTGVTVSGK